MTVVFISLIICVTKYFVFVLENSTSQNTGIQHPVIIYSYLAQVYEPQGISRDMLIDDSEVGL